MIETFWLRTSYGIASRFRIAWLRSLGMRIGKQCRLERIRVRRPRQIELGDRNSFTEGCWLWPEDSDVSAVRIRIGEANYFNRDVMIDACGRVEIGSHNMFGPGVYITDSNHTMPPGRWVNESPMDRGTVVIGDGCWIGTRATILKDVRLGDRCLVAAGAVVTKSFPAGSVVGGVPARTLKMIDDATA